MANKGNDMKLHCSFCGKSEDQVKKLIYGPGGAYICDDCVRICAEIIDEEFGEESVPGGGEINLMKPVETDRLNQALDKVQSRVKPQPQSHSSVERIPVVKSGRKVLVPIDQIRYIEAKDDYSCIYTDDDRYLSTISLAKLEQKLAPHGFFRVHRGYIVNLEYVEDVEVVSSGILQLGINGIEGKKISVSRRRVVALKLALGL